jgi:predicted Fe-Mo cluster-binding NifX family protein
METKKIAVPLSDGTLSAHFGHCQIFEILSVDESEKTITRREELVPPPHEPGLLPKWLSEQEVTLIIAGGMGSRAVNLFNSFNIEVITGAPALKSDELVQQYLTGTLKPGSNVCDH